MRTPTPSIPRAILRPAFVWTCDACGRENFVHVTIPEYGPGEKEAAFREMEQLEAWQELPDNWDQFQTYCCPERVECPCCHKHYAAVDAEDMA